MNTFGNKYKISIFGESHGEAIGIVIDGVPAGLALDFDAINAEMQRRAPGNGDYATERRESDIPEIISGVKEGVTSGFPVTCTIRNTNVNSADYSEVFRPGHADWPVYIKHKGYADMKGGGHSSGRLTAGLVFAGAIAKQILAKKNIFVYGRIKSVGNKEDDIELTSTGEYDEALLKRLENISKKKFSADEEKDEMFRLVIANAKENADSVGGTVEAVTVGMPAGVGEPFFASVESKIAEMLFSIPAVKGVEFGKGFEISKMRGSEANDPIVLSEEGCIISETNYNGGILGGISNGMPIVVSVAIKPTASIGMEQRTVDPVSMIETKMIVHGRHDPCIVPRAVPVVEAGIAIVLLDFLMEANFEQ